MDATELAWLAGWLEGEGSFKFDRTSNQLCVAAASIDRDVLEYVRSIAGGHIYLAKKAAPHYSQPWHWHLTGPDAVDLMTDLRPFMFARRGAQVDDALSGYENRRRRGGPQRRFTDEEAEQIRMAMSDGIRGTVSRLAREFDVNRRTINRIANAA